MWKVNGYPPDGGYWECPFALSQVIAIVCPTADIRNVLFHSVGGMTIYLPNGGFRLAIYW